MNDLIPIAGGFLTDPFELFQLPFEEWITQFVNWLVDSFRQFFRTYVSPPVKTVMEWVEWALTTTPPLIFLALLAVIGWRTASWKVGLFAFISFAFIGFLGLWEQLMVTLALVITSVLFCLIIGIPVGILCSRRDLTYAILRPVLDIMQTTPPFVYLVPAVMMFSIGNVPGLIATIIFAMPPTIRLTNLGIRQVPGQYTEAATAFGSTPRQILWKIQIPLALPTIMAGLNQTIMLALSMVVIAAIIGAGGLGLEVFQGLNRLDIGQAFVGGIGIVLLAMVLDRITQGLGDKAPGNRSGSDE